MQINLSHGEMFQKIFEGGLPEKTYNLIMLITRWFLNNCNYSGKKIETKTFRKKNISPGRPIGTPKNIFKRSKNEKIVSLIPGSVGYISHVHWAYDYLGPFGVLWVDTKIVLKKKKF